MELNKLYTGECSNLMSKYMSDNFVDLTVTSPPYSDLRDYQGYEFDFPKIAKELFRVTKKGGVLVWVVGDKTINGSETGESFRQALYFKDIGFKLHDTMIYEKSAFSNPSRNRYHQVFEYMFVFCKGKLKTFNPIKDKKNKYAGTARWGKNTKRQKDGTLKDGGNSGIYGEWGMRYNVWRYSVGGNVSSPDKIAFKHSAIFPEKLAEDHILSWSNEGDIIFDPMVGSGTTVKMAVANNRQYIGIDISEEYCKIARERVKEAESKRKLF